MHVDWPQVSVSVAGDVEDKGVYNHQNSDLMVFLINPVGLQYRDTDVNMSGDEGVQDYVTSISGKRSRQGSDAGGDTEIEDNLPLETNKRVRECKLFKS